MTTTENIDYNFRENLGILVKGLQVIHITTPTEKLHSCQHDEVAADVLQNPRLKPFDQIPVQKHKKIIGLLKRDDYPVVKTTQQVGQLMKPLGDVLVSADTPLLDFITEVNPLDRLVVHKAQIYGLVTKSDLLKLPARLLGYALVTYVEAQMLAMIHATGVEEKDWIGWVRERDRLEREYDRLLQARSDPDKLELTTFADKSQILRWLAYRPDYAKFLPDKALIDDLSEIVRLRDTVAHTNSTNADHQSALTKFVHHLRMAEKWIKSVENWQKPVSE